MVLPDKVTLKIIAAVTLLFAIPASLWPEIIILENGEVFEGKIVKEDENEIELKTPYGVLTISKGNIKQIAQDVKELLEPADELWTKAKACYDQVLELRGDPGAMNKERLKGQALLYETHQIYDEVRQLFPQDEYAWIDQKKKEILRLMKIFRSTRVRVVAEPEEKKSFVEEPEMKEKLDSLDTKAYAEVLCTIIPAMLEGRYNEALLTAETRLSQDHLNILKEHLTSNNEILEALKKETSGYVGDKFPLPIISGLYFDNRFLGLKDGQFTLDSQGRVMSLPIALFQPDQILALLQDATQDHLARGWFCMQNLWFTQAQKEFEAGQVPGELEAYFFTKLLDEHANEFAEASLPVLEEVSRHLVSNGNKFLVAFMCQASLEILLQHAGIGELLSRTGELTTLILDHVVKEANAAVRKRKSSQHLGSAYAAELAKLAHECMLKGKDNMALLILQKALTIDGNNPYAFLLRNRLLN